VEKCIKQQSPDFLVFGKETSHIPSTNDYFCCFEKNVKAQYEQIRNEPTYFLSLSQIELLGTGDRFDDGSNTVH